MFNLFNAENVKLLARLAMLTGVLFVLNQLLG
jgi:hypothetical protein